MSKKPRMSAPIGRVRIKSAEVRKRRASGSGRWQPAAAPTDAEATEADEASEGQSRPTFYPFSSQGGDESGD